MNDNEIIKGLECCCGKDKCSQCPMVVDCPFFYEKVYVGVPFVLSQALDLINRQKAKIEALQMDYQQLQNDIVNANMNADHTLEENEQLKSEIEQLKKINDTFSDIGKMYSEIKAEVIKEFAERLKQESIEVDVSGGYGKECYTGAVPIIAIDNLVKEMAGEA